ncbi:hypothetical protein [Roseovarius aestuarii]|nr:hypothetical protein [Roseovarius aestuarii]
MTKAKSICVALIYDPPNPSNLFGSVSSLPDYDPDGQASVR